jgi:hypothetical protein
MRKLLAGSPAKFSTASMVSASIDPFKVIGLAPKHRFGFRVFAKQAAIDRWRQSSQRAAVSSKQHCIRLVGTIACALLN